MNFDTTFRQTVPDDLLPLLDEFEEVSALLAKLSTREVYWQPPEEPQRLFSQYIDVLVSIYTNKLSLLSRALIQALNSGDFLSYGMIGRSVFEHTAVLRYYLITKMLPMIDEIKSDGVITPEETVELLSLMDKHIRGNRFAWEEFFSKAFDSRSKIRVKKPFQEQVNVKTCIDKWVREEPSIGPLYGLFCDLVHPNLGSTLLITRLSGDQLGIGGSAGEPLGLVIFTHTFQSFLNLFKELVPLLRILRNLKLTEKDLFLEMAIPVVK